MTAGDGVQGAIPYFWSSRRESRAVLSPSTDESVCEIDPALP